MGIIQRQGIKYSIVNYFGVLLGAISTIFIYPLDKEVYGLFRFIVDSANFFTPFILIGSTAISIRFFHLFDDSKKSHHGFLTILLLICGVGAMCFISIAMLGWDYFRNLFDTKASGLYLQFVWMIVPIAIIYSFILLFRSYCSNFKRIVVPSLLEQLIKVTFPIFLILYFFNRIELNYVMYGVIASYLVYLIAIIIYTKSLGQLLLTSKIKKIDQKLKKEIASFGLYGILGSAGSMLALRIDTIMVGSMKELSDTGIYSIAALIGANIAIPLTAITSIAAPIITKAWGDNNMEEIEMIYKKSSINSLIIGCFLFLCIWLCLDDLFKIMPKGNEMISAKYVVFWIGMSKLFDMATGVNDIITGYSKYYRFNFYTLIILGILNIFGNLLLIPIYGALGAAIATFSSSFVFNLLKFGFIKYKLKMSPFSDKTLLLIFISFIIFFNIEIIPNIENQYLSIIVKGVCIFVLFVPTIYFFRISDDVNGIINSSLRKLRNILKL